MRRLVCILLVLSILGSYPLSSFAKEVEEFRYGVLNVEYSDSIGTIERLDVMVRDSHVYVDAYILSERLGYKCMQEGDLVSIYANNSFFSRSTPLLAVHFKINSTDVSYNPMFGAECQYTSPAPCIMNEKGVWVPLAYTLILLGGNSSTLKDTVWIQMPQENILSVASMIANNESLLSFDWVDDFGYSETTTDITNGAARMVTLFSGLLEFDGAAWLSLIDWSAFDKKFGNLLITMFCTYSEEELDENVLKVEALLDVFSDDGTLGSMLHNKQMRLDSDATAWQSACEEYLQLLEDGSGSPAKYNLLYRQYERAMDKQNLFAALGGEGMAYIQDELSSATNALDIASILSSTVSYLSEFQQKDEYIFSVLKNYLRTRTETDNLPEGTAQAMRNYLNVMDLGALGYGAYRYIEENWLQCLVDESGLDMLLGAPANVLLFAWNIISETMPFYDDGLDAVKDREISNYAQKMQNDALVNLNYLLAELKYSSTISAEDCMRLSEYCYVYLKASYIARSAAVASLDSTSTEFREQVKGKLANEAELNQIIARNLAILSSADVKNSCYILGFLQESNEEYLRECSDKALLAVINPVDEQLEGDVLSQVNAYNADGSLWYRYDFAYNDACQLTAVCNSTDPVNQVIWQYSYDDTGRLVRVERTMSGNKSTMKAYVYDEKGLLNRWYVNDGYGGTEYSCTYDEQNRRIQTVGKNSEETIVTKCEYNSDGLLEQQHTTYKNNSSGESYSTLSQFEYDADGRIVYNHIDAGAYTYQYTYRYDLGSLCVCQDDRGTYVLFLYDEMNSQIWEMDAAGGTLVVDEAGRLAKIQCDGVYYEFLYKDSFIRESTSLSKDDMHSLNVFLTYFSQQGFNEVDPKTYEAKADCFTVQNADPAQLIRFVDLYTKINNDQIWYNSLDQDSKVHLSLDYINNKLQQFFGVSISPQDVEKCGYELRDGNVYFDFALGETYNYMTIVRSCEELSNETVCIEFDIYRGEGKYMYAGGPIVVEDVYWYSTGDAKEDSDLFYYKSGTATIRRSGKGNNVTYQLLEYELN